MTTTYNTLKHKLHKLHKQGLLKYSYSNKQFNVYVLDWNGTYDKHGRPKSMHVQPQLDLIEWLDNTALYVDMFDPNEIVYIYETIRVRVKLQTYNMKRKEVR